MNNEHLKEADVYYENILSGNRKEASKVCHNYLEAGNSILRFYERVMKPSLYKVGLKWEQNEISVATEHLATAITEGILNELYSQVIPEIYNGNKVVLACVDKEEHQVGIKMAADIFEMNGWESFLVGENKKMSTLNQEVNNLQRQLIKEKTKLQHTLSELRETQQMLIHSEKMNALGQLVAGVAHEINNPIGFVTNNLYELEKYSQEYSEAFNELKEAFLSIDSDQSSGIIQDITDKYEIDFLTEDIREVLVASKSGVERVKKIVEDLRRFSRLDESEIKRIDLIESIRSSLTIVQSEIDKKNINFTFLSDEQLMIDCFPGQLNQALLNIIINAVQAVSDKGTISLSVKAMQSDIQLIIKDNGCGISEENRKKIFDPFFTTKPVGTGTGLGLSITYKIIHDLHKGSIEVDSAFEKGTAFIVRIPKSITA